jgi:hypothetical protein
LELVDALLQEGANGDDTHQGLLGGSEEIGFGTNVQCGLPSGLGWRREVNALTLDGANVEPIVYDFGLPQILGKGQGFFCAL